VSARNVLVTGGYGLLGGWLVRALLERGDRVTLIRRDQVPSSPLEVAGLDAECAVVDGDILDAALMDRTVGEYEIDTVFHLAAQTIVGTANRSPVPTFEANVRGTWTVLDACRRHGVARTVVASSDKAYGRQPVLPYTEEMPLLANHPYDASKAAAEYVTRSYWSTYGLRVATTRFANLYGGGDLNRSRLIPGAIASALAGEAPVVRSDGSPERDFLYVEDAARAYLAIADALDGDGAAGEAFNAGSGVPRRADDVVRAVCAACDTELEPDIRGTGVPHGEIDRQWLDSTKLRTLTGWAPAVELADGLARTVAWTREHAPG
jgi:CDP-glucose 4,6-dehydratase